MSETTSRFWWVWRSRQHFMWFCYSVMMMLFVLTNPNVIPSAIGMHGLTMCMAICKTNWGRNNGPVYSIDCIWFNGLLLCVYIYLEYRHVIGH